MRAILILLSVMIPVAASAEQAPSEMRQRTACISDAFRLCASSIPDKVAIRACLGQHHAEMSDGCRDVYDASVRAEQ